MRGLNGRKIFLFGFIAVLLIGIPVTIYLVQRQQDTRSRAEKATNLNFTPDSSPTTPIKKSVGDSIPLDIFVDPGTNLVTFVKLEIQYDPEKLATASAGAFTPNITVFPNVLEGPVYSPGKVSVTLSVGSDPTKAVQIKSKAATVTFRAINNTPPGTPTVVSYGASTQVLSSGFNDQYSENVLSSATPANIEIGGQVVTPTEPIPTGTPAPTTPITPTIPVSISPPISATPSSNVVPVCSALTVDKSPSGVAPLTLNFATTGNDPDGTVAKVSFNFGDGQVVDVTDPASGVGTASISAQTSYTYNNPGTYTATSVLTDNANGTSTTTNCTQTVSVGGGGGGSVVTNPPVEPPVSLPPTGASDIALGIGAVLATIIIGGGLLFLFL